MVHDHQLELSGLEAARLRAEDAPTKSARARALRKIETTHDLLSELPSPDDLLFNHSGLCQTFLPHSRPANNTTIWKRESGKVTLMVTPGVISIPSSARKNDTDPTTDYVGIPFGTKARLIMFHLQTEGLKSRTVHLGNSLSAFLRSLGLTSNGGPRGTIHKVREQCVRIARCTFTIQWSQVESNGNEKTIIRDSKIVEGLEMWNATSDDWSATIELSESFHSHLKEHAVPLDKRSIGLLSGNSVALDLYALLAYRLPKLKVDLHVPWEKVQEQIGSEYAEAKALARRIREVLPEVRRAYPHANVDVGRWGIIMKPSPPSVPRTMVHGHRLTLIEN